MDGLIVGIILGVILGFFSGVVFVANNSQILMERGKVIAECELNLPRNQKCDYIITARVVK